MDDACLVASELLTNAVVATEGATIEFTVKASDGRLLLEVWDASDDRPEVKVAGTGDESGRGLAIVEFLAEAWGCLPCFRGGKTTWARLHGGR